MAVNPRILPGKIGNFAQSGSLGYAVGDPVFLASQQSRVASYWRLIEYGTHGFIGHQIGGLWTSAYSSHAQRGNLIGGDLSAFGGQGQKFVPFFGRMKSAEDARIAGLRALNYLRFKGQLSFTAWRFFRARILEGSTQVPTIGIVNHEIIGQEAYKAARVAFEPVAQERRVIQQLLGDQNFGFGYSLLANRRERPQPTSRATFRARTGFLNAQVLSGYNYSLVNFDASFRSELTQVNRALALGLANAVAEEQRARIKRAAVSTGALVEATLAPQNRFPA